MCKSKSALGDVVKVVFGEISPRGDALKTAAMRGFIIVIAVIVRAVKALPSLVHGDLEVYKPRTSASAYFTHTYAANTLVYCNIVCIFLEALPTGFYFRSKHLFGWT